MRDGGALWAGLYLVVVLNIIGAVRGCGRPGNHKAARPTRLRQSNKLRLFEDKVLADTIVTTNDPSHLSNSVFIVL